MALGSAPEVVAVGLLVVSAVAAALVASLGAPQVTDAAGRRLALAVLFTLAMGPAAIFLAQQRSPVEVTLRSIEPRAGVPIVLARVHAQDARPPGASGPVVAAFGSLEIAVEPPGAAQTKAPARVTIALPVREDDCLKLEDRLEGSCRRSGSPGQLAEPLTIESLDPHQSLTAEVTPEDVRLLELSESTPRSQRAVPDEWALAGDGGTIELEVRCGRGNRMRITQLPSRAIARCGPGKAKFHILLAPPSGAGLSLFLSELSEFQAHLGAERAQADIEAGRLEISGAGRNLPLGPVPIDLHASSGDSVDLDVRQAVATEQNQVSLESNRADRVDVIDRDERPSWLGQNTNFVYFVLGLVAATLVSATLEFVLRVMNK